MKTMHKCNETKSFVSVSEGSVPEQADTTSKTVLFRTNREGGGDGGGTGMGEVGRRIGKREEGGLISRSGRKKKGWCCGSVTCVVEGEVV